MINLLSGAKTRLRRLIGLGEHNVLTSKTKNIKPVFSTRVATQVETIIESSGPDFAFAYLDPDGDNTLDARIYIPSSARLIGGDWWEVRRGRRVRLAVVLDWHDRGLRALGLTLLDDADSAA